MDAPEISVYGEAKGEYTRQLCVFLTPCLETYFLELLDEAKKQSPSPSKNLWQFQNLLQSIPDWNQDKVVRETDLIQKDCKCDYLEELLTAVFIAHTKVLSAIRLTTKQKKLQITIPKIDHFLHRVLSDCARSLWTNAYLFAETNSIEKQKSLRQVSSLIQEAILQAIRGLLPVKSILREYLHDDEDEGVDVPPVVAEEEEKVIVPELKPVVEVPVVEVPIVEVPVVEVPVVEEIALPSPKIIDLSGEGQIQSSDSEQKQPMIYIDTKPSVSFSQGHILFDSNSLEANEIHDLPFAEAELRNDDEEDDDADEETKSLTISNDYLPMDLADSEEILG